MKFKLLYNYNFSTCVINFFFGIKMEYPVYYTIIMHHVCWIPKENQISGYTPISPEFLDPQCLFITCDLNNYVFDIIDVDEINEFV